MYYFILKKEKAISAQRKMGYRSVTLVPIKLKNTVQPCFVLDKANPVYFE